MPHAAINCCVPDPCVALMDLRWDSFFGARCKDLVAPTCEQFMRTTYDSERMIMFWAWLPQPIRWLLLRGELPRLPHGRQTMRLCTVEFMQLVSYGR